MAKLKAKIKSKQQGDYIGIYVGASEKAIAAARDSIMALVKLSPKIANMEVKQRALDAFQHICAVSNVSISNVALDNYAGHKG